MTCSSDCKMTTLVFMIFWCKNGLVQVTSKWYQTKHCNFDVPWCQNYLPKWYQSGIKISIVILMYYLFQNDLLKWYQNNDYNIDVTLMLV
jgi:hypothetical protein